MCGGSMQVGDLVMWLGKDEHHGMMGVIAKVAFNTNYDRWCYTVQWSDGVYGIAIWDDEIMAVEDAPKV